MMRQNDRFMILPSGECTGSACEDVAITYLGPGHGYKIKNAGPRRISLRVQWSVGLSCLDWSSYELNPGEAKQSHSLAYCDTIEADYIN